MSTNLKSFAKNSAKKGQGYKSILLMPIMVKSWTHCLRKNYLFFLSKYFIGHLMTLPIYLEPTLLRPQICFLLASLRKAIILLFQGHDNRKDVGG